MVTFWLRSHRLNLLLCRYIWMNELGFSNSCWYGRDPFSLLLLLLLLLLLWVLGRLLLLLLLLLLRLRMNYWSR